MLESVVSSLEFRLWKETKRRKETKLEVRIYNKIFALKKVFENGQNVKDRYFWSATSPAFLGNYR